MTGRIGRKYQLLIGTPVNPQNNMGNNALLKKLDLSLNLKSQDNHNVILIEKLNIDFKVKKDTSKNSNTATITIFNLDNDVVNYIATFTSQTIPVRLDAGYNTDERLMPIFIGSITKITDNWSGATRKTKITCGDGTYSITECYTARTYQKGTSYLDIISDFQTDLGLPTGAITIDTGVKNEKDPNALMLTTSKVFIGSSMKLLDGWCKTWNHHACILNGALFIFPLNGGIYNSYAKEISTTTGLINSITPVTTQENISTTTEIKPTNSVKFQTILDGDLELADNVYINTNHTKGVYTITNIEHSGTLEGSEWTTTCSATLLPNYDIRQIIRG